MLEGGESLVECLLAHEADLCQEGEVLFGREVVDEESLVDVCARELLPLFRLRGCDAVVVDAALVGLEQVEYESEEGGLAGSVVAYESQQVAVVDGECIDVAGRCLAEALFQVFNLDHR